MSQPLRLRELQAPSDPALWRAYLMLQRTFPTSELVRAAEFLRALTARAAGAWHDLIWHMIVGERGSFLEGVATGTYISSINIGFIGYLAVDKEHRSQGVGDMLRKSLLELFNGDAWHMHGRRLEAVVGEIEPDNPWLGRLVRDYGAIPLDLPYAQPALRPGQPDVPLILYYQPLTSRRRTLPVDEVRHLLYGIWHRAYRIVNPFEHSAFRTMMRELSGRDVVGATMPPETLDATA